MGFDILKLFSWLNVEGIILTNILQLYIDI